MSYPGRWLRDSDISRSALSASLPYGNHRLCQDKSSVLRI